MKDIAIYGAGGLGREIACVLNIINTKKSTWNLIGFFDDGKEIRSNVSNFGKILGGINELNNWDQPLAIALCFGKPQTISLIRSKIDNPNILFPNIISPSIWISDKDSIQMGEGNIFAGKAIFTTNITLGNFNLFNGVVTIGHDTVIGDYNVFMDGVHISGGVEMENRNFFGTSSFVKQQLKIGNDVSLSPLSALLTKPKDGNLYIGNPAKIFKY